MDKSGYFFKVLPDKGQQAKRGKKTKQRFTIAFSVNVAAEKVD